MNYYRILPRDLFNESKLLKGLGKIALLLHDEMIPGLQMVQEVEGEPFIIEQDESDGSIYVSNLGFFDADGEHVHFSNPLNCKGAWPLVMLYKDEVYFPLNEKGEYQLADSLFLAGEVES